MDRRHHPHLQGSCDSDEAAWEAGRLGGCYLTGIVRVTEATSLPAHPNQSRVQAMDALQKRSIIPTGSAHHRFCCSQLS